MKKKKRRFRFTRGEKVIGLCCAFLFTFAFFIEVFCKSFEGNLGMSVEKLKYQISIQEKKNESLTMQVNELTSYDKIKDIVKEMGLSYNNENIIVIEN
ncbi:MAG: hypothetical protein RSB77_00720 [Bacilli bacterium]